ncbi:MAG: fold metallo-hydrolase [Paenibacillus sp.]|nr:fold metallo-hydrolase [Paenibacillus sp.]
MPQEQLTFFGGLTTTGGVHLLYGHGKNAILFDFGIAHKQLIEASHLFTLDPVRPTPGRAVRQYVLSRLAPPILDLYDPAETDGLRLEDVKRVWGGCEGPKYEHIRVFAGHNHQDHMMLVPYLHPSTTLYMSADAYAVYRGVVASGEYFDTKANVVSVDDLSHIDFGSFTVQVIGMDHNSAGSSGLIIDSAEHRIAYTGDWRRHGRRPELFDRFVDLCATRPVDILITETTRVTNDITASKAGSRQESEVLAEYKQVLKQAEGLVYTQLLSRDVERLADFIALTVAAGRTAVLDGSLAVLWHESNRHGIAALKDHPAVTERERIRILDITARADQPAPYANVSIEEMADSREQYVYFLKYPNFPHMIELETIAGGSGGSSRYVHADHPLRADDPSLQKVIKAYGITLHTLSNGGHASPDDISELIERVAPRAVIPIHGPKFLDSRGIPVYYPERGSTVAISDIVQTQYAPRT